VLEAPIGSEETVALFASHQHDAGGGKAAFGGIEEAAGDGHIRAQRHARQDVDGARRVPCEAPGLAHALVAAEEPVGIPMGQRRADGAGE